MLTWEGIESEASIAHNDIHSRCYTSRRIGQFCRQVLHFLRKSGSHISRREHSNSNLVCIHRRFYLRRVMNIWGIACRCPSHLCSHPNTHILLDSILGRVHKFLCIYHLPFDILSHIRMNNLHPKQLLNRVDRLSNRMLYLYCSSSNPARRCRIFYRRKLGNKEDINDKHRQFSHDQVHKYSLLPKFHLYRM